MSHYPKLGSRQVLDITQYLNEKIKLVDIEKIKLVELSVLSCQIILNYTKISGDVRLT